MMKRRLRIVQDSELLNPRTEWDGHIGRMICFHSRYDLGDEHSYDSSDYKEELACESDSNLTDKLEYLREDITNTIYECLTSDGGMDWKGASEWLSSRIERRCEDLIDKAFDAGYIALPLYLYDHSGITMSTGPFSCGWDSGCVGLIVMNRSDVEKQFNGDVSAAEKSLRAEVEEYDHYLTGNCWGFVAEEFDGDDWNEVDSCWGFLGHPEDVKADLGPEWSDCESEVEFVG